MIRPFPLLILTATAVAIYGITRQPNAQDDALAGIPYVIDGDTIIIGNTHIRLAAIDAPESDQTCKDAQGAPYNCGLLATSALEQEIAGRSVRCIPLGTDKYGRTIATCYIGALDLGEFMVRAGYAIDYARYDQDGRYAAAQADAKAGKRGIWIGTFMEPEAWRHRR